MNYSRSQVLGSTFRVRDKEKNETLNPVEDPV